MTHLLVSHTADLNGAERSLLELATGLSQRNKPVLVLCPEEGPLTECLRANQIRLLIHPLPRPQRRLLPLIRFLGLWLPTVLSLRQLLIQKHVKVVYNNTIDGLYAPFAAWLANVPCVWHIREVKPNNNFIRSIFARLMRQLACHTLFNSEATLRAYTFSPPGNCHVVYNGVKISEKMPEAKQATAPVTAAFVGQFTRNKQPQRFLEALALARRAFPQLKAVMAGDGPLLVEMRELAQRLNIADNVQILGYVETVEIVYSGMDFLVLTSDREAFGRTIMEAMAHGRAVIAARVDGVPELVEDNITGFLVEADDISAYAHRMIQLAQDVALRQQMGLAGRERILHHFTLEQNISRIAAVLDNCLNGGDFSEGSDV
jgi:glycosyltransferase involved in cell wall biosynthesis